MEGIEYLVALSHFEHFGPRRLKFLLSYFGSWEKAWQAKINKLLASGLKEKTALLFLEHKSKIEPNELLEKILKQNIKLLTIEDDAYPPLLKEIYAPPPLLYYKGSLNNYSWQKPLAVVGTRKASSYGRLACENLVSELTQADFTIVSGLALGIDAMAHEACLNKNGKTIAFLGSGVDQAYPKINEPLATKITESGGAIISEFPPKTKAFKSNFPRRNRLIAGASLGVLVIEAAKKSGALITARYGLDENREVMAIPGSIYSPSCQGTNNLIKQGARVITETEDIINLFTNEIKFNKKDYLPKTLLTKEEELIMSFLSSEEKHINELIKTTKLDTNIISSRLTIMEMKGLVKNLGNMQYIKL